MKKSFLITLIIVSVMSFLTSCSTDSIVPAHIVIEGAYFKDEHYINNCFNKIKNKTLTKNSYESFMNDIYLTGNYKCVLSRFVKTWQHRYSAFNSQEDKP